MTSEPRHFGVYKQGLCNSLLARRCGANTELTPDGNVIKSYARSK